MSLQPTQLFMIVVSLSTLQGVTFAIIIPESITVFEGDHPVFSISIGRYQCTDLQIHFKPIQSHHLIPIYRRIWYGPDSAHTGDYEVFEDKTSGSYALKILNTASFHAGTYVFDWGSGPEEAELTVIARESRGCTLRGIESKPSSPVCEFTYRFECVFRVYGNVEPIVEFWQVSNQELIGPIGASKQNGASNLSKYSTEHRFRSDFSGSTRFVCQLGKPNGNELTGRSICVYPEIIIFCGGENQAYSAYMDYKLSLIGGKTIVGGMEVYADAKVILEAYSEKTQPN